MGRVVEARIDDIQQFPLVGLVPNLVPGERLVGVLQREVLPIEPHRSMLIG